MKKPRLYAGTTIDVDSQYSNGKKPIFKKNE
jgi:hypothetical protein